MKLYKFQAIDKNTLSALIQRSLYFCSPKKLNDPTEGLFHFTGFDPEDGYSKLSEKCSILSMGVDNKESHEALSKSLFHWAHYADGCKGICLVFNKDSLISSFLSQIIVDDDINYGYPASFDKFDYFENIYKGCEEISGSNIRERKLKEYVKKAFFNKPKCFNIESEFRFVKKDEGLLKYDSDSLDSVIIGEKINSYGLSLLIAILRPISNSVSIKMARVKRGSFQIFIDDYYLPQLIKSTRHQ